MFSRMGRFRTDEDGNFSLSTEALPKLRISGLALLRAGHALRRKRAISPHRYPATVEDRYL